MKKLIRLILCASGGAILGIELEKITKQKQHRAKVGGKHIPFGPYEAFFKRPLDVLLSGCALILFSPIIGITALLVKINLGSPVLFTQLRPGKNEKIFKIYKYRTMTDKKSIDGKLLPDKERLTKFGSFLRSTSLDELPELINILKGDMSVVGPRPLLVEYLERYNEVQRHRHDVRPGLTGYAQVNGRNRISWEEKFCLDMQYVNKITFIGDIKIIFKTIISVIRHDGISSKVSETMEAFLGNEGIV